MILADAGRHIGVAVFRAVTNLALCDGDVTNMALLADAAQGLVADMEALGRLHRGQQDWPGHAANLFCFPVWAFSRGGIQNVGAKGRP
jgi:hypothetical protein